MAVKKRSNAKGVGAVVATLAVALGPKVVPALVDLAQNPEALKKVVGTVRGILDRDAKSPQDLESTIRALREQVGYLADSADDDAESQRAKDWAKSLDQASRAAKLVAAPGASAKERKIVKKKVTALRAEILEALIIEKSEDLATKPDAHE